MGQRLAHLAELVSGARTGEDLVRPLLRLMVHSTGMQAALLTEPDESPGMQRVAYVHDEGIGIAEGLCIPWTDTLCKRAFDEGRLYVQCAGTPFADLWIAREYKIRTFVSVPVRVDGQVLGTLCGLSQHEVAKTTNAVWAPDVIARLIGEFAARESLLRDYENTQQQLATLVRKDPLTRLPNREYVRETLERMLAWTRRDGMGLLVGFIDLDDFKSVNDRHGGQVGERFLVAMAERLRASLRSADLLGRVGDDQFIVIAPVLTGDARRSEEVLRSWLTRRSVTAFDLDGVQVKSEGASVGLVQAQPGDSVEAVLARADAARDAARRARRERPQMLDAGGAASGH
ncbi:sensor domain-containing diguanylate cyclase [Cognatilysobacter lacus]|uniref:Sensor domain-containing diguanylate cyclase n=1 Tax=Cognatilysobacter lacus TaxID=1643323 RepID=A0A5D8Z0E8_9GAMM|nr:sensor domain-containing diguanylate cyclase [Lysobacter lacus]TZF87542.1 sensor domain-containing diguanylate cyclase [Lysobacter lacus]